MKQSTAFIAALTVNIGALVTILLTDHFENSIQISLLCSAFLIISALYSFIISSSYPRTVSFILVLYWAYGLILPAIYQVNTGNFFWKPNSVNYEKVQDAALLTLVSVIFFIFGYATTSLKMGIRSKYFKSNENRSRKNDFWANISLVLLTIVSAGFAIFYIGLTPLISTRASVTAYYQANFIDTSAIGLARTLPGSISIAVFMILAFQLFILKHQMKYLYLTTAISFLSMALLNFPISIPRYVMVCILFIIVFVVFNSTFLKYRRTIIFTAPILIFLIFPFLGKFNRGLNINTNFEIPPLSETFAHGDFDGFQSTMNAINLVAAEGFSYGTRLFSALLFFIPRDIWPSKHNPTGSDAASVSGYDFLNISMPLPAEIYVDFGYVGVALGMLLIGKIVKHLDFALATLSQKRFSTEISLIGVTFAAYMPILFRGPLLGVIAAPASVIFVIFIWTVMRRINWRQ